MTLAEILQEETSTAADDLSIIKSYLTAFPNNRREASSAGSAFEVAFDVRILGAGYGGNEAGSWANRESPFFVVRLSHALILVSYFLPDTSPCPA